MGMNFVLMTNCGDVRWFAANSGIKKDRRVERVNGHKNKEKIAYTQRGDKDMLYSEKKRMDRRNSVVAAIKKELKANNAYVAPEVLRALAEKIDTKIYYGIEVVRDAEEAAKLLKLSDIESRHSWAGSDGCKEEGIVVFGNVVFGKKSFYEYFDNGESQGPEEYTEDVEFDMNNPFAVIISGHDWRSYERDCCNYDNDYNKIVIYSPEVIYDEKEYVERKDAELEEICRLRK